MSLPAADALELMAYPWIPQSTAQRSKWNHPLAVAKHGLPPGPPRGAPELVLSGLPYAQCAEQFRLQGSMMRPGAPFTPVTV